MKIVLDVEIVIKLQDIEIANDEKGSGKEKKNGKNGEDEDRFDWKIVIAM